MSEHIDRGMIMKQVTIERIKLRASDIDSIIAAYETGNLDYGIRVADCFVRCIYFTSYTYVWIMSAHDYIGIDVYDRNDIIKHLTPHQNYFFRSHDCVICEIIGDHCSCECE